MSLAAAALLLTAASLKLLTPSLGTLDGSPRVIGAAEVALGCWVASGIARRWALPPHAILFTAFALYHAGNTDSV